MERKQESLDLDEEEGMVGGGTDGVDDISFPRESEEGEVEVEGEVLKERRGDDRGRVAGEGVDVDGNENPRGGLGDGNVRGGKDGLEGSLGGEVRQLSSGISSIERAQEHEVKAFKWYRRAAKLGHPWGIVMTSECYMR
jgi:hypothetical protein